MSITALRAAFDALESVSMGLPSKIVLLILADHHNQQTGRLDPSVERIAKRGGISVRAVQKGLRELESLNLITTVQRVMRTGRGKINLTNRYRLSTPAQCAHGVVSNVHPNLKDTPRSKRKPKPSAFDDLAMITEAPGMFDTPSDPDHDLD